jgi:hypothetical protein
MRGIIVKWKEININDSQIEFENYCSTKSITIDSLSDEYKILRNDILKAFNDTLQEIGITETQIGKSNYSYQIDYSFGLKFFELMNKKYQMTVRVASNEKIWRYISVCVVPDIVDKRYGVDHPDRFWKKSKRIWLRCIWWYIYLSWQGNSADTKKILKDNSTDEILQLVDRCGRGGYRLELYREIMKIYGEMDPNERRKNQLFRKLMVLNTARVQVIEPGLVDGGETQYIKDMCDYLSK